MRQGSTAIHSFRVRRGIGLGGVYYAMYSVLWVLFWPARAWMKKNRPEDDAASQLK